MQGAWGGQGAPPLKRRVVLPAPPAGPPRADVRLPHVIINEKRNRAAAAFQVPGVPFPFATREQYEHSLQQPLGPEWNAQTTYQAAIKPRVLTKRGAVIAPLVYTPPTPASDVTATGTARRQRRPL
jgi:U3 small nucleolar RNA-associated protein 14